MKAQGIQIVEGFLVVKPYRAVPDCFWSRLRALITKAHLLDEYEADRKANAGGEGEVWVREERLFARWVRRVVGEPLLWPWSRGWTQAEADTYLDLPGQAGASMRGARP